MAGHGKKQSEKKKEMFTRTIKRVLDRQYL